MEADSSKSCQSEKRANQSTDCVSREIGERNAMSDGEKDFQRIFSGADDEAEPLPDGYTVCPYCGEPVKLPGLYCCEEHEEGRSLS